jgi:G3E family GTPase
MTLLSLVLGGSHAARERAIAESAEPGVSSVAIIEGLPTGEAALDALPAGTSLEVFRVASGCPCCSGNLTMRVTLNRALRQRPERLYLSLSNAEHKSQVLNFLQEPQYLAWLRVDDEIDCS